MGFEKGTLTSTASATRFSISRSIARLYLDLTYSGFAAYRHATRPPRGVMPTRSPIPRTAAGGEKFFSEHPRRGKTRLTCVDVRRTRLERSVCVGDGHSGVVVQVYFDIAADNAAKGANKFVYLARICTTNGIGDADAVDPNFIYRLVDGKEVHEIGAEGILRREADLDAL